MTQLRSRTASLAALVAAVLTLGLGVVLAQPASATPVCTGTKSVTRGALTWSLPSSGSSLDCHLQQGNTGNGVRSLQNHMNLCYSTASAAIGHVGLITKIAVDGDFGPATRAALIKVQRYEGTGADGVYGPATRRTMNFFADEGFRARCVAYGA